jgi:signal transduction histidine kinase
MAVKVAAELVSEELPEEHKTCIYRVVQEALHNSVRHAAARNVRVTVRQQGDRLVLSIEDDGAGFDAQHERGLGLLGIEERVTYLGGSFKIDSAAGHGTVLNVVLPLAHELV